jgi:hypothetical protein
MQRERPKPRWKKPSHWYVGALVPGGGEGGWGIAWATARSAAAAGGGGRAGASQHAWHRSLPPPSAPSLPGA